MFKRSVSPNQKVKQRKHYRCELNNGVYEGDILHYRKDGIGMFIHDDGNVYFGGFYQDNFHGEGVILFKQGGIFYGQFERGKVNGFGCLQLKESFIVGFFSQSTMHGRVYLFNSQTRVWKFCEYQQGKKIREIQEETVEDIKQLPSFLIKDQQTSAKFINFLDLQLETIFKKDVNCSLSLLECESNTRQKYVGYIDKSGNLNGLGCIFTNDLLQMCGSYEDGKIQGLGRTLHDNGDIYDGYFRRDQMEGQGIYYTQSTNTYIYAYFKRNECIKVLNGGTEYPAQLVRKMKQKIHEKSVEYLDGNINLKGIGINLESIIKSIKEDLTIHAKRQKNQFFDVSRCEALEDEEQILKKVDFAQQEQSSRASYRKSSNGSTMSNHVGAKLQIFNQSQNKMITVQPFNHLVQSQIQDDHQLDPNSNQNITIDAQGSPVRPSTSILSKSIFRNSKMGAQSSQPKSPVMDRLLSSTYQKEVLSQSQNLIKSLENNNNFHALSDRTSANPKAIFNNENLSKQNSSIQLIQENGNNNGSISVKKLISSQMNQSKSLNDNHIASQLLNDIPENLQFNQSSSNLQSPQRSQIIRSKIFDQSPLKSSQQINQLTSSTYQKNLTFSPQNQQKKIINNLVSSQLINSSQPYQQNQSTQNLKKSIQMSPTRSLMQGSLTGRKYSPIFQDNSSSLRLSTIREIQNSSLLESQKIQNSSQLLNQSKLLPKKREIFNSQRDLSAPILNSRIETPKLNSQIFLEKRESPTKFYQQAENEANQKSIQHNEKLKMQIGQQKYYSPSFNSQSLTLGELIKQQQNSAIKYSPNRNSQNNSVNNSYMNSQRQSSIFNQENRPNYSEYGLSSQRFQHQPYNQNQFQYPLRDQSPPSPLKIQRMKIFQDISQPMRRSQNLNLNVSFQDQNQDQQQLIQSSNSPTQIPLAFKTSKFVVPNQLNQ